MKMPLRGDIERVSRRGFTLVELMVSTGISVLLGGSVILLLVQSATEQRNGYAANTVEEQAYTLEANITSCLRSMSANQGISPVWSSAVLINGITNGYSSVVLFYPTNGAYIQESISFNASNGTAIYTPNTGIPTAQVIWMTNNVSASLTELYFSTSWNMDGSQNNSLITVTFQMTDNGFSQHNPTNNPANVYRTFSVQMRND